tara:strand:- start:1309 stop:5979 length:4671 start_codon:yes stop_codon:yes gene_type:complete
MNDNVSNPKPSVRKLIQEGFYDGHKSSQELFDKIASSFPNKGGDETKKGDAFQEWVMAKFQAINGLDEVYRTSDIPLDIRNKYNIAPDDNGIDLVIRAKDGKLSPVQIKFWNNTPCVPKAELDSFFNEAKRFPIGRQMIVTSAERISNKISKSDYYSEKKVDFDKLTPNQMEKIAKVLKGTVKADNLREDFEYRKQQDEESVPALLKSIKKNKRTGCYQPTGTGKTATSIKLQRALGTNINLYAAPRRNLATQIVENLTRFGDNGPVLAVFSKGSKKIDISEYGDIKKYPELNIPTTTDVSEIVDWLKENKKGWIVAVYDSIPKIAQALKQLKTSMDYAVIDEAHHTAGLEGKEEQFVLHDENIQIKYRLFTTATPVLRGDVRMDDESIYGPVGYFLSDYEAEKRGLINPVENVISIVTDRDIDAERGYVIINGVRVQAQWVATQVAFKNFQEEFGVKKTIACFHRKEECDDFVGNGPEGINTHIPDLQASAVHSGFTVDVNEAKMTSFEKTKKPAMLCQINTINEGRDFPWADSVLYAVPMSSKIRVKQVNGRTTRKPEGKPSSKNLIPVFLNEGQGETFEDAVRRTRFDIICETLAERMDEDGVFSIIENLDGETTEVVRGKIIRIFRRHFTVRGTMQQIADMEEAIVNRSLNRVMVGWDQRYSELVRYYDSFDSLSYPSSDWENEGPSMEHGLHQWVVSQRTKKRKGTLSQRKHDLLEKLPQWDWNPLKTQWENAYEAVKQFHKENGYLPHNMSQSVKINGKQISKLNVWLTTQRQRYKKELDAQTTQNRYGSVMPEEEISKLEEIGMVWDPLQASWHENYNLLKKMIKKNKNYQALSSKGQLKYVDGINLGGWCDNQRQAHPDKKTKNRAKLEPEKVNLLTDIGFVWNVHEHEWMKKANQLHNAFKEYNKEEGMRDYSFSEQPHVRGYTWIDFPLSSVVNPRTGQGVTKTRRSLQWVYVVNGELDKSLKGWTRKQIANYNKGRLDQEKIDFIERINKNKELPWWNWDQEGAYFDTMMMMLELYKKTFGDCDVPKVGSKEFEKKVNTIIGDLYGEYFVDSESKPNKGKLHPRQCITPRLECLSRFVFETRAMIVSGKAGRGSSSYIGRKENVKKIIDLGLTLQPNEDRWEKMFLKLIDYKKKHGHCLVKSSEDKELATWVSIQRHGKNMTDQRKIKLDGIGFSWNPDEDVWLRNYANLMLFKSKHGHTSPTKKEDETLHRWVWSIRKGDIKITPEKRALLDAIKFSWKTETIVCPETGKLKSAAKEEIWDFRFNELKKFYEAHGHSNVMDKTSNGLGSWVTMQRTKYRRKQLSKEQIRKLDSVEMIWEPLEFQWNEMYEALSDWKEKNDTTEVTQSDNKELATWISVQRTAWRGKKKSLTKARKAKLDSLGFVWEPNSTTWEQNFKENYNELKKYYEANGHCNVLKRENHSLSGWVNSLRQKVRMAKKRCKLTKEQIKDLNKINFDWNPSDTRWNKLYDRLVEYHKKYGHCEIPAKYLPDPELGRWVVAQRQFRKKTKLSEERIAKLEKLGYVWEIGCGGSLYHRRGQDQEGY